MRPIGTAITVSLVSAIALAQTSTSRFSTTEPRAIDHVETLRTRDALARAWSLTEEEATRYQQLMRGPRSAFSVTHISPLEVLGIHAKTPTERRAYADRLVKLLFEDTERVLAFEREVQAAWVRLGQPMFDPTRLPVQAMEHAFNPDQLWGRRLAVFVATSNCPRCADRTRELVRLTASDGPLTGLDIYVVDTRHAESIRAFARRVGVATDAVVQRRITLNPGEALFQQYQGADRDLPKVFVRGDGQLHRLADSKGVVR